MKFLSLFAGIGGFDLGLERAGMTCVGQVEIDPYCRAVLAKHWPDVPRMEDVRDVQGTEFGPIDLICGGVPCQPASCAGKRRGADDERWLWGEWIRLVRVVRPAWFVAENVRGFLSLAASAGVVRDLEGAGYEVRTLLLGAHHVGAPHRRDRIWVVGHATGKRLSPARQAHERDSRSFVASNAGEGGTVADSPRGGLGADGRTPWDAGHADERGACRWPARPGEPQHEWECPRLANTTGERRRPAGIGTDEHEAGAGTLCGTRRAGRQGQPQPRLGEPASRASRRLVSFSRRNALKALGNCVVPDVAEVIGRAIMATN